MASGCIKTCILSHGRSGTTYTARVLQALGLDFGHECEGRDGSIGGIFLKGNRNLKNYQQIFHQLRSPLRVISSTTTCRKKNLQKTFDVIGVHITEKDPLRRAMQSWLAYVEWAEEQASWWYRVEDMKEVFPKLCSKLGIPVQPLPTLPKNLNARPHPVHNWADLLVADAELTQRIQEKAAEYGYSV